MLLAIVRWMRCSTSMTSVCRRKERNGFPLELPSTLLSFRALWAPRVATICESCHTSFSSTPAFTGLTARRARFRPDCCPGLGI